MKDLRVYLIVILSTPFILARIFTRCELAQELSKKKYRIPEEQIATWVCIAQHESNLNTSAIGSLNGDESQDHGIFQISDKYWCSPPGSGQACGQPCSAFEDDDIRDDVICARRIYRAHQRMQGDGFLAWAVYSSYCLGTHVGAYVADCGLDQIVLNDEEEIEEEVTNKTSIAPLTPKAKVRYFQMLFGKVKTKTATSLPIEKKTTTTTTTTTTTPITFSTTASFTTPSSNSVFSEKFKV